VPPYEVTAADILWLLRAVEAEGPDEYQVAAVLVNGFMWNRSQGGKGNLTGWVRAYAQPINPAWYLNGAKHREKLKATTSEAERTRLIAKARVRETVHSTVRAFHRKTHEAVQKALSAAVPIDPRAVDYAAPGVPSTRIALEPNPVTRNQLYTRVGATTWQGYSSDGAPLTPGKGPLLALLGASLATTAAYLASRKGKV
jgi:hypothetical protein